MTFYKTTLAAAAASFLLATPRSFADSVGMRTTVATGETISLTLNAGVQTVITWGNGSTEDISFGGTPQSITVLDDSLLIETDGTITSLYCADCGLATLNVTGATSLETLICNDNQIATLDLTKSKALVTLNCQRNDLSVLRLSANTTLEEVNCAQNAISSLTLGSRLKSLKTLIVAQNELTELDLTYLPALRTLWCQENEIATLNTANTTLIRHLYAYDNQLTELDITPLTDLDELVVDDNQIDSLDLTKTSQLIELSAENNALTYIGMITAARNYLDYFYVSNNYLFYNSFPTISYLESYILTPQNPYPIQEAIATGETLALDDIVSKNAWSSLVKGEFVWKRVADGYELVEDEDVELVRRGYYKFLKEQGEVYAEVTAPTTYEGITLYTSTITVLDDITSVNSATAPEAAISTQQGTLTITVPSPTDLMVYSLDGRLIVKQQVAAGTHSWALPGGVYLVNGKKVLIAQ